MLPPETRLMPLCLRYLQIHYLDETPVPYQYPIDDNPALMSLPKSDPGTIPITLKINNDVVHDNFFCVKATYDKTLGIVQRGVIKVLAWSFDVKDGALELKISKAITMTNAVSSEQPLAPLEHNSRIRVALHKLRYKAMLKLAITLPVVVSEDTESDITENSALGETHLAKLEETPVQKHAVLSSPQPKPQFASPQQRTTVASPQQRATLSSPQQRVPLTSPSIKMTSPRQQMTSPASTRLPVPTLEPEGYFSSKPQMPEPMVTEPPVDIGRGAKSKENAEDFSRARKRKSPLLGTQDDLLSPYKVKKTTNVRSEPRRVRLTSEEGDYEELTLEKFPDFALEYLKYYYNL